MRQRLNDLSMDDLFIKDQPANVTDAINAARVAELRVAASFGYGRGRQKKVKDAIAEQLQSVKEELVALTINAAAPSQHNFQRQQQSSLIRDQHQQKRSTSIIIFDAMFCYFIIYIG